MATRRRKKKTSGAFYKKTQLGRALTKVNKPGHKGALHRALGVPEGRPIPKSKLRAAENKPGRLGKMARFAENMGHMHKGPRSHRRKRRLRA